MRATSPLHYELSLKHYDHALAVMPLAKDIDLIEQASGMTALCMAATDESADAIDMVEPVVLKFGANLDLPDSEGYAPMHHAAAAGNYAVVRFLADHGAEIDSPNAQLEAAVPVTPLFMALQRGRTRVATFLELRGAEILASDIRGNLELGASIGDAMRALVRDSRRDENPQVMLKKYLDRMVEMASETLQQQGRMEELAEWQDASQRLSGILDSVAFEDGLSRSEHFRQVRQELQRFGVSIKPKQGDQ